MIQEYIMFLSNIFKIKNKLNLSSTCKIHNEWWVSVVRKRRLTLNKKYHLVMMIITHFKYESLCASIYRIKIMKNLDILMFLGLEH